MELKNAATLLKKSADEQRYAQAEIIDYICKTLKSAGLISKVVYKGTYGKAVIEIDLGYDICIDESISVTGFESGE